MFEDELRKQGLFLPPPPTPAGAYIPAVQTGSLVFVSGQLPLRDGQLIARGTVEAEVSLTLAREAAQVCVLNALACLKAVLGDLQRVRRIVRLNGYVASAAGFAAQPQVINGASELLKEVFGEAGLHTRVAVGVAALPLGAPVEIDLIVEIMPSAQTAISDSGVAR